LVLACWSTESLEFSVRIVRSSRTKAIQAFLADDLLMAIVRTIDLELRSHIHAGRLAARRGAG
jgi:hypothetical protein